MLNMVLALNALSCLIFGSMFVTDSATIAAYLGSMPQDHVVGAGIILVVFAAHLVSAIFRHRKIKGEVYYFVVGDLLWVMGTIAIFALTDWITTSEGTLAAVLVAVMVATFAGLQYLASRNLPDNEITIRRNHGGHFNHQALMNFEDIASYHPAVQASHLLAGAPATGLGARRECTFTDGSKVEETVTRWSEGRGYRVRIEGIPMPIKHLENEIDVDDNSVRLTAQYAGNGFVSEILLGFLMRPLMRVRLQRVVDGFIAGFAKN